MSIWDAVGAGIGLLGGIFGGKKEKQSNRIDYRQLRKDAEKGGFNPAFALANGGSAGYTVGQTHGGLLGSRDWSQIGNSIAQLGGAFSDVDPVLQRREDLQEEVTRAQLANIRADTAARVSSMNAPKMVTTATSFTGGGGLGSRSADGLPTGNPTAPEIGKTTVTNPFQGALVDPRFNDAEMAETRYADILSNVFGFGNLVMDASENVVHYGKKAGKYIAGGLNLPETIGTRSNRQKAFDVYQRGRGPLGSPQMGNHSW